MSRPRPRPRFGPEGIGRVLSHGSSVGGRALPELLAFYQQVAEDLQAGRRQLEGYSTEQTRQIGKDLARHVKQARLFPGQIRERGDDLADELGLTGRRRRQLTDALEGIVEGTADAYASGITMGFFGARVAVEELRPLVEQQLARSRAGGRAKSLEHFRDKWQEVVDAEYRQHPDRFKLSAARNTARNKVPKVPGDKDKKPRLACRNTIAKYTKDPRDRDRTQIPGM